MTARQLQQAQARYLRASQEAHLAQVRRDAYIRAMARGGHTHAEIYRVLNGAITRSRIGQIAQETEKP